MISRRAPLPVILSAVVGCAAPQAVCPPPVEVAATAPAPAPKPELALETDDDKTLYAMGQMVGRNVAPFALTPRELEIVQAGMADKILKRPSRIGDGDYTPRVDDLARSRAKLRAAEQASGGKAYLEEAARRPGATPLPSGALVRTETPGTGPSPGPTDRVTVHYEGKLIDGTVFDSSRKRGPPSTFPLSGVIKCWTEGVGRMKVGETAVLVCPADTAYGEAGRPPTVPGGATLIFEVELLGIER